MPVALYIRRLFRNYFASISNANSSIEELLTIASISQMVQLNHLLQVISLFGAIRKGVAGSDLFLGCQESVFIIADCQRWLTDRRTCHRLARIPAVNTNGILLVAAHNNGFINNRLAVLVKYD